MAAAAAILGVASTLYSAKQQSDASQSAADASSTQGAYGYRVGMQNAAAAEASAQSAVDNGNLNANRLQTQTRGTVGSQRASYAGQGVDVTYGSAADVNNDTLAQSGIDANTIRSNAWQQALGLKTQAANDRQTAAFSLTSGANESGALRSQANTTLITGGLRATGDYMNYYSRDNSLRTKGY